jgi:hypothetical protein
MVRRPRRVTLEVDDEEVDKISDFPGQGHERHGFALFIHCKGFGAFSSRMLAVNAEESITLEKQPEVGRDRMHVQLGRRARFLNVCDVLTGRQPLLVQHPFDFIGPLYASNNAWTSYPAIRVSVYANNEVTIVETSA